MFQLLPASVGPVEHEESIELSESTPTLKPEARPSPTAPEHVSSPRPNGVHAVPPGPVRTTVVLTEPYMESGLAIGHLAPPPAVSYASKPAAPAPAGPSGSTPGDSPTPAPAHEAPPTPSAPLPSPTCQSVAQAGPAGECTSERCAERGLSGAASDSRAVYGGQSDARGSGAAATAADKRARRRLRTLKPLPRGSEGRLPPLSSVAMESRESGT